MRWTARDIMKTEPKVVPPEMRLSDLERAFVAEKVSGFPVVSDGRLVGIVSRSDVVRQLCIERSLAENISHYYHEAAAFSLSAVESLEDIVLRVGRRLEDLHVRDVMARAVITAAPEQPVGEVAKKLLEHSIHRLPVVEEGRLVGIVTSLDLVRLLAERSSYSEGPISSGNLQA